MSERVLQQPPKNAGTKRKASIKESTNEPARKIRLRKSPKHVGEPSATQCGLLSLPREVRDQIYGYVWPARTYVTVPMMSRIQPLKISLEKFEPPVSRTCRLLRTESLPIFYRTGLFIMTVTDWHIVCMLKAFRSLLPAEHAHEIRNLHFMMMFDSGWLNAARFLQFMEESFSKDCQYSFYSDGNMMGQSFQKICRIAKTMRGLGADWDTVQTNMDEVECILHNSGWTGEWDVDPECWSADGGKL